jgi:hypothetical protein
MTGGLLQLVAKGVDDMYISGTPQITLFKCVYKRPISFSLFDEILYPKSNTNTTFSSNFTMPIERRADLLHKIYMIVDLPEIIISKKPPTFEYINNILKTFEITQWDYSPNKPTDIVTLDVYNNSLVPFFNDLIVNYIYEYNFFVTTTTMSSDPSQIIGIARPNSLSTIKLLAPELANLNTENPLLGPLPPDVGTLLASITNGRTAAISYFYNMLLKYPQSYNLPLHDPQEASDTLNLEYLPKNTDHKNRIYSDMTTNRDININTT